MKSKTLGHFSSLFERWSAKRGAALCWLLVRPGRDSEQPWQWRRLPGNQQGDWPPPSGYLQDRVALVIPAPDCSHFQVAAPPGLKRHEWPLLLEEQLQQQVDHVQVHCLSRSAGYLQLLVIERARVQGWLADAEALGVLPDYLWAEPQLMPQAAPGETLCWTREHDRCLVRSDAQGRQQWLTWPAVLGDLPHDWQTPTESMNGPWPERWAALEPLPNLLEQRRVRKRVMFTPLQRRLTATAALLGLCWATVALVQYIGQVPAWKAQVAALTGPLSRVQQATRSLARVQGEQADWRIRQQQLVVLEQGMGDWLGSQQGWGVSGSYFDGRTWRLVLSGDAAAAQASDWQGLAQTAGATASAEPSENCAQLTVRFDLGAQP